MKTLWLKLLGINSVIWSFLAPILKKSAGDLLTQVLPIAKEIVLQIAVTNDLPNVKRDKALIQVRDAAQSAGINAATSVLNLAIELALQSTKN